MLSPWPVASVNKSTRSINLHLWKIFDFGGPVVVIFHDRVVSVEEKMLLKITPACQNPLKTVFVNSEKRVYILIQLFLPQH